MGSSNNYLFFISCNFKIQINFEPLTVKIKYLVYTNYPSFIIFFISSLKQKKKAKRYLEVFDLIVFHKIGLISQKADIQSTVSFTQSSESQIKFRLPN
jgi:molybdopterin synthase catalytic subunit